MSKQPERLEEQLWRMGINARPAAVLIEELTRPTRVAVGAIFNDLTAKHALMINACWKGIVVEKDGDIVYEDGKYEKVAAVGEAQCSEYRRRTYIFLRWCCTHYPTDLLNQHKGWLYGR